MQLNILYSSHFTAFAQLVVTVEDVIESLMDNSLGDDYGDPRVELSHPHV